MAIDIQNIREQFPILHQEVNKRPLVYFDNGATTHKPNMVIDRVSDYYQSYNSNIHRAVHTLSQRATEAHEETRKHVQRFINAAHSREVVFTRGTTEAINLVAHSFGKKFLNAGDEVLISAMEHHSNIVPWQMACMEHGASLKVIPFTDKGELDMEAFHSLLNEKTRIVAINHVSNTLGTINPIREIIEKAHAMDIPVLIDGAQSIAHVQVDVQALDVDFYCFSGHKMYGPMGIGVLYGKEKWLEELPPYQGGGEMIDQVTFEKTTWNELPFKFEAGTPNVADTVGLKAAIEFMEGLGVDAIAKHEDELLKYATEQFRQFDNVKIIGEADHKAAVLSFNVGSLHPFDTGTILDKLGIAVRTGTHCTQPIMDRFGIPGTVRATFAVYNTQEEVDALIKGIHQVKMMFE